VDACSRGDLTCRTLGPRESRDVSMKRMITLARRFGVVVMSTAATKAGLALIDPSRSSLACMTLAWRNAAASAAVERARSPL